MDCHYCKSPGTLRVSGESNPLKKDLYCCESHWTIMKNKELALPFLVGRASQYLRDAKVADKAAALEAYKRFIASKLDPYRQ